MDDLLVRLEEARERRALLLERKEYQERLEQEVAKKTADLQQRVKEVSALNNMIQSQLNQVFATRDTYEHAATAIRDLADQIDKLAEIAKVTA